MMFLRGWRTRFDREAAARRDRIRERITRIEVEREVDELLSTMLRQSNT